MRKFPLELRASKIDKGGVGVFARRRIRIGEKLPLCEQGDWKRVAALRDLNKKFGYRAEGGGNWVPKNWGRMSIGWYLNHSTRPNIDYATNKALRPIAAGQELTVNYAHLK